MSAMGGIYNFNGAPANKELLVTLGNRLSVRGPDGGREVLFKSIGMAYRAFHTNKESRLEVQPLVSHNKHVLTWDGRLDNREELISLLRDDLHGDNTDIALVLAAYLKWGVDCLPRLIGDFALSFWDPTLSTLFLARDAIGCRPLFYHVNGERIIWSSELAPLLDLAGVELEINDEYVASYLCYVPEQNLTPYKTIYSVPPGNLIILRDKQLEVRRFWQPDPNREIRYRSDADYEEHFRELFKEAVRCRLRVDGPVWSHLSGGLDSSSMVCMADQILQAGTAQASKLETVSFIYEESPTSDEREFIRCVEERISRPGYHLPDDENWLHFPFQEDPFLSIPSLFHCYARRYKQLYEVMRRDGARVLHDGNGGDHMLWSSMVRSPELVDLLSQCKLFSLHRSIQAWSQVLKEPYFRLLKGAVRPILPKKLQAVLHSQSNLPGLFDQKFVVRVNLNERFGETPDIFGFRLPSSRRQSSLLLSAISFVAANWFRERECIEVSYPYLHRPLIEFLIAIPFEQKLRPGETRSIQRRSLKNMLPEEILRRKDKRGPEEAFYRAFTREWPKLRLMFSDARVCNYGYADARALDEAFDRILHGQKTHTPTLLAIISLEFWLRSLEERRSKIRYSSEILEEQSITEPLGACLSSTDVPNINQSSPL